MSRPHGFQSRGGATITQIFFESLFRALDPEFRAVNIAELEITVLPPVPRVVLIADPVTRLPEFARRLPR